MLSARLFIYAAPIVGGCCPPRTHVNACSAATAALNASARLLAFEKNRIFASIAARPTFIDRGRRRATDEKIRAAHTSLLMRRQLSFKGRRRASFCVAALFGSI